MGSRELHGLHLRSARVLHPWVSGGTHAPPSPPSQLKEEAGGTLDAVQVLAGVSQLLPKSRENYLSRCMDQERLRRESTSQKEMDKVSPGQPMAAGPRRLPRRGGCLTGEGEQSTEPECGHQTLGTPRSLPAGGAVRGAPCVTSPSPVPSLCLLGRDQDQEGGREPAALRGEVQLGPRGLRAEDAGLRSGKNRRSVP